MIRRRFDFLALSLVLCACGEKSRSTSDRSAEPDPEEAPFTGPLTIDRLMKASGKVDTFQEWSGAYEKLEKHLGKPTHIDGKRHGWGVMDGDSCVYMYADKDDRSKYIKGQTGDMVAGYLAPKRVEKTGPLGNYAECTELAGKEVGPPEDPKAIAPPTDGSSVPLATFLDNAVIGRSKWDKQKVKLSALANGISTAEITSNGQKTGEQVTVGMVADEKATTTFHCSLPDGSPKPEQPGPFEPLVAEGTVRISKLISPAGEQRYSAGLEDCTVTFLGKTKK